jgi:hypothetical protein
VPTVPPLNPERLAQPGKRGPRLALNRPAVVIDYVATIGPTYPTTFLRDTTYFVSGAAIYNGAVTIEGGAVFKYPNNVTAYLKFNSTVTCKTDRYRPAIFTAGDDNTVGDQLNTTIWSGYTGTISPSGSGNGYYGNPAIWSYLVSGTTLSGLKFYYAKEALKVDLTLNTSATVAHAQFIKCVKGVTLTGSGGTGCTAFLSLVNTLWGNVDQPFNLSGMANITAYHTTVHAPATRLVTSVASIGSLYFTNSVLANITTMSSGTVTLAGNYNGFTACVSSFGGNQRSAAMPFVTAGAGNYYINDSTYRNFSGGLSTAISTLADLKNRTTYAPAVVTGAVGPNTTWNTTAVIRDTASGDTADLGYHYDPLDYLVTAVTLASGNLTMAAGTAVGLYGDSGISLGDNAVMATEGTPLNRNHLSRYVTVQEQPVILAGTANGWASIKTTSSGSVLSTFRARFTEFDGVAGGGNHILMGTSSKSYVDLRDNLFNSAFATFQGPITTTAALTNNLFEGVDAKFQGFPVVYAYNCLFKDGRLTVNRDTTSGAWTHQGQRL